MMAGLAAQPAPALDQARFNPEHTRAAVQQVVAALPAVEWITDSRVERLSQDFYWFSPVLKRQLAHLRADAVARPRTEDQVRAVVAACARHQLPITVRGSGTGNYGQCMPLHGGVILDLSAYNQLLWCKGGVARAQAGLRLMDMDKLTQPVADAGGLGWELRCVPSTYRSATLGGLYGGGFGGVGSINHGPLASTGNVLGVRAMSIEPEPRVLELRGADALLLHHVYGTAGLVLELEVALAPAHAWMEAIVCFEQLEDALGFGDTLAQAPGVLKKSVTLLAHPIPDLLQKAVPALAGVMTGGTHAVLVLVAECSEGGLQDLVKRWRGQVSFRKTAAEVKASNRTIIEYTWNHTTLHALKVDKSLTYIQSSFQPGQHVRQVQQMHDLLGGANHDHEVMTHVEFIRNRDGAMTCSGLQLVRYRSDERLNQVMQLHRDHGVGIANPHVYIVEDGKQGQVNPDVVATKMRFDPGGLLNPGKLRGWDQREQIMADVAAGKLVLAAQPRFEAARLVDL